MNERGIYISREGSSSGPYPESYARELLLKGELLPTDIAWCSGEDEWKPLSELLKKLDPSKVVEETTLIKRTISKKMKIGIACLSALMVFSAATVIAVKAGYSNKIISKIGFETTAEDPFVINSREELVVDDGEPKLGVSGDKYLIHKTANIGNVERVKQLLSSGVDIELRNNAGGTPLHAASANGRIEVVKLLISKGANVNAQNIQGGTPLNLAIGRNHREVADFLRQNNGKTLAELKADKSGTIEITSEGRRHTFGGPLRPEEKSFVGNWRGSNSSTDSWEIIRREDHTYTIAITWDNEGRTESFSGHGLWSVKGDKYFFVDVLDHELEQDEDWPIELKHRIPHEELVVITENVKITKQNQLVTTSKGEEGDEITTHTETRAEEFKQSFTVLYKDPEARHVQQISDNIRRALIKDYIDIAEYFEGPLTEEERILVGRWKFTTNDPDDDYGIEIIRRQNRTATFTVFDLEDQNEEDNVLTHGFWKVRQGKYIYCDIAEEKDLLSWEETYLSDETLVHLKKGEMITEYIDPERRVLAGLLRLRIRNKEVQVDEFKLPLMQPFSKKDPFDSVAFIKRVKATKRTASAKEAEPEVAPEPLPEPDPVPPEDEKLIADPIIEKAIRNRLKKPDGQLTEEDFLKVTFLHLGFTDITDASLKETTKLKNLEELSLGSTKITDAGLKEVAKLQKLETLLLTHTKITDVGLKNVAILKNLTWLDLSSTQITDTGLKEVAKLKTLESVHLKGTRITDEGLKEVAKLEKLEWLVLHSTNITNESLMEAAKLKNLKVLNLYRTKVTEAGVAEFKKALPNCEIIGP